MRAPVISKEGLTSERELLPIMIIFC